MLAIIQTTTDEMFGVPLTVFRSQLARGIDSFHNQQCSASLVEKNGGWLPPQQPKQDLPQDGNYARSKFAGKTIQVLQDTNPRREGTKGHRSFDIVLKAGGAMSYDLYRLMGGRAKDLQWDIDHGHAELI